MIKMSLWEHVIFSCWWEFLSQLDIFCWNGPLVMLINVYKNLLIIIIRCLFTFSSQLQACLAEMENLKTSRQELTEKLNTVCRDLQESQERCQQQAHNYQVQCSVITCIMSFFPKSSQLKPRNSPTRVRYRVSIVSLSSDYNSASIATC